MAGGFKGLGKKERAAVAEYVSGEYDRLVFQSPNSYVSLNAQNDPDAWQERLREMIASDPERVREIMKAAQQRQRSSSKGFTLIEMSIVPVIIGLIVGGVLVGQSLIGAAAVRAQISQIEKFNTAANTFREKYGYLPGDIKDPDASSFGFASRGQYAGEGDGNGVLEGVNHDAAGINSGLSFATGEIALFWEDLSKAHLIDQNFWKATATTNPVSYSGATDLIPFGKIGNNSVYVYSQNTINYFGLSASVSIPYGGTLNSSPGLTVSQAAQIDKKIDDGFPLTGNVVAQMVTVYTFLAPPGFWIYVAGYGNTAVVGSATTCFDDAGNLSNKWQYSVEISNGSNMNCALSFKMQAGD